MPPGVKLLIYSCFAAGLFLIRDVGPQLVIATCVLIALLFVPFRRVRGGFLPIMLFLGFTFVSNLFHQSGRVMYVFGSMVATYEGLRLAAVRTLRVFDMIYAAKILTAVTPLEEMIDSLRRIFQPLERVGLPVHDFFSAMALTLRAFPVLKQRLQENYRANIEGKGAARFDERVKLAVSFLIPLFVESMRNPEKFFEHDKIRNK